MNMILYKSTHCPFLHHYPLSNQAVFFKHNEEIKNLSLSVKYPQSCMIPPQWQISHRSHNFRAEGLWLPLVGG